MKPEIWSIFYELPKVDREARTITLSMDDFKEIEEYIDELLEEQARLRKMLYDMTFAATFEACGYDPEEWHALRAEFEPKQED